MQYLEYTAADMAQTWPNSNVDLSGDLAETSTSNALQLIERELTPLSMGRDTSVIRPRQDGVGQDSDLQSNSSRSFNELICDPSIPTRLQTLLQKLQHDGTEVGGSSVLFKPFYYM